jgi:hypothetical protein
MTGLKTILAAVALAAIFSTPGDAQKVGKVNFPASSPTDVSHHALQSARLALVIGNSSYPDADVPLAQAINDARALASTLRKDAFDVDLIQEATGEDMARAIARLKAKVRPDSTVRFTSQASACSPAEKATRSRWTRRSGAKTMFDARV